MSLLPAFDDESTAIFDATSSWVNTTARPNSANTKFTDDYTHPFDFSAAIASAPSQQVGMGDNEFETLFGIKFPSPSISEAPVFDAHTAAGLSDLSGGPAITAAAVAATAVPNMSYVVSSCSTPSTVSGSTSSGAMMRSAVAGTDVSGLQLDVITDTMSLTPNGSPRTAASSGYASPAFQLSPTPGLTVCPTVDSTPGARSNSRCSSRSSFSMAADASCTEHSKTTATVYATAKSATPATAASASAKPKKLHLCPYEGCARATRTFRSNADLQRHIRSHRGERPYACPSPGCGKAYGQQNKMVNHVRQQHPALLSVIEIGRSRGRRNAAALASAASSLPSSAVGSAATSAASSREVSPVGYPPRPHSITPPSGMYSASGASGQARPAPYTLPTSAHALALTHQLNQHGVRRVSSTSNVFRSAQPW